MSFDFKFPEIRINPEFRFNEVMSDYQINFEMIETGSTTTFTGGTITGDLNILGDLELSGINIHDIAAIDKQLGRYLSRCHLIAIDQDEVSKCMEGVAKSVEPAGTNLADTYKEYEILKSFGHKFAQENLILYSLITSRISYISKKLSAEEKQQLNKLETIILEVLEPNTRNFLKEFHRQK